MAMGREGEREGEGERKRVNEKKKTLIAVRIEGWQYNKIQEEKESGESDSDAQVVRKALRERFRPKGAW